MAQVALPELDHASVNRIETLMSRDAQSPMEVGASEGRGTLKHLNSRTFRTLPTSDLISRLDERDKEVQELLLAGETAMQSSTGCDSSRSSFGDESPPGFKWEVPEFPDIFTVEVSDYQSLQAKRGPTDDLADCSPVKRCRSQCLTQISEDARGLGSMMARMSQRLALMSDPQYIDDLLALEMSQTSQPEEPANKQIDDGCLSEVERLREENLKLKESLAESQREKAEMSKVLLILEDRLAKSNEFLRNVSHPEEAKQPKYALGCASARQRPAAAINQR